MSIFKNQSLLTLNARTSYTNLASAEVKRILYKKPGGTAGYWEATASGTDLVYNFANGDLDIAGQWTFAAYIELGGLKGYGDEVTIQIKPPIL
jgi:hypothetical protein